MQIEARRETLGCGCEISFNTAGRLIGFREQCEAVTAIFGKFMNEPETREVSAARSAEIDEHIASERGKA